MNIKTSLIAAFSLAAVTTSQAFNIDFNTITVADAPIGVSESFTVNVADYGTVTFTNISEITGSSLAIDSNYSDNDGNSVNSLELNTFEIVQVTFNGAEVINAQAVFAGNSANPFDVGLFVVGGQQGDEVPLGDLPAGSYYAYAFGSEGSDGVGLQSISWDVVPEPSSAALGALGMSMILLRRRKI